MIAAEAEPLPDGTPGYARVVVTGAPKPPGPLAFILRREGYSQGFLGRNGWQVTEEMLTPVEVLPEPAGGGFAVILGPEVSRHMTAAPYVFRLPALNAELPIFWPEIEDEVPGIEYVRTTARETPPVQGTSSATVTTTTLKTETPPVIVDPPVTGGDTPPREEEKPSRPWIWLVLLLVLAAIGAGLYVFREPIFGGGEQVVPERGPDRRQQTETRPPPPTPPQPAWPAGTDGFTPREVVAQAADGAAILSVAKRRQSQGRHDDAYTLLEEAAQRDQGEAWFLLARLYDPIGFVAGRPFQTPNAYEAARHYREAERRGYQAAAEPRAALRAQLQQRADGGDAEAAGILREFWP